jgi:hypothetical protein
MIPTQLHLSDYLNHFINNDFFNNYFQSLYSSTVERRKKRTCADTSKKESKSFYEKAKTQGCGSTGLCPYWKQYGIAHAP